MVSFKTSLLVWTPCRTYSRFRSPDDWVTFLIGKISVISFLNGVNSTCGKCWYYGDFEKEKLPAMEVKEILIAKSLKNNYMRILEWDEIISET